MTEKEAIKLVKKQNRQHRINTVKNAFSTYTLPVIIGLGLIAFAIWPIFLDILYEDNHPTWLLYLEPIWCITWVLGPFIVLFTIGAIEAVRDRRQEFRDQVQAELRLANKEEERDE